MNDEVNSVWLCTFPGNDSDLCASPATTPKKTKVEVYKLTPQQKALIKDDEANTKLWNEALDALKEGPVRRESITDDFLG